MTHATSHQADRPRHGLRIAIALMLWAGLVTLVTTQGWLAALPTQTVAPLVGVGIALPLLAYAASPGLRAWIDAVGLRGLTVLHVWRIAAAVTFFWYGGQGLLPERFVLHAGWGDLFAGILAVAVVLLWRRSVGYWTFHVFGFGDFVLAVGTGLYFSIQANPQMDTIATFPVALIPLFGVGISGATHIVAFRMLLRGGT